MNRAVIIPALVCISFAVCIHRLVILGEDAQRTFIFSVIKELEDAGGLKPNVTADEIARSRSGKKLLSLSPLKTTDCVIVVLSYSWAVMVIGYIVIRRGNPSDAKR